MVKRPQKVLLRQFTHSQRFSETGNSVSLLQSLLTLSFVSLITPLSLFFLSIFLLILNFLCLSLHPSSITILSSHSLSLMLILSFSFTYAYSLFLLFPLLFASALFSSLLAQLPSPLFLYQHSLLFSFICLSFLSSLSLSPQLSFLSALSSLSALPLSALSSSTSLSFVPQLSFLSVFSISALFLYFSLSFTSALFLFFFFTYFLSSSPLSTSSLSPLLSHLSTYDSKLKVNRWKLAPHIIR